MNNKIGIVTWYNHDNCGGNLQAYALFTILKRYSFNPKFLCVVDEDTNKIAYCIKRILKCVLSKLGYLQWKYISFQKKYLKETLPMDIKALKRINGYKAIICGSDQIWAPNVFNPRYFLDFVDDNTTKISYAPSIGLNTIPDYLIPEYKTLISRLNYISVREKTGKQLLNQIGIRSCVVADPTILLRRDEYSCITNKQVRLNKYIFCYLLNKDNEYNQLIESIKKKYNMELIVFSKDKKNKQFADLWLEHLSPDDFLGYLASAEYVVTDSYHGTVFSLIFNKQFKHILRFESDDPISQNSRVTDLFEILKISVDSVDEDNNYFTDIDYHDINNKLEIYRNQSLSYLLEALNGTYKG